MNQLMRFFFRFEFLNKTSKIINQHFFKMIIFNIVITKTADGRAFLKAASTLHSHTGNYVCVHIIRCTIKTPNTLPSHNCFIDMQIVGIQLDLANKLQFISLNGSLPLL